MAPVDEVQPDQIAFAECLAMAPERAPEEHDLREKHGLHRGYAPSRVTDARPFQDRVFQEQ